MGRPYNKTLQRKLQKKGKQNEDDKTKKVIC